MVFKNLETLNELAERWKVPMSWLYSRTREGGPDALPKIKIGKYIRVVSDDVDRWLKRMNEKKSSH